MTRIQPFIPLVAIPTTSGTGREIRRAALNACLGMFSPLSKIGVLASDLVEVAKGAMKGHLSATNPRETSEAEYLSLLQSMPHLPRSLPPPAAGGSRHE